MGREHNIYTIAREAGVSPATVSRVMTQNAKVSEEKRQRVEAAIRKYDYRPNALAQGLSSTRTRVIGILAAEVINPYYGTLITSCEKAIVERGYIPMICGATNREELEVRYLQKMCDMRMDAVILIGGKSDDLVTDPEYADLVNQVADSVTVVTTGKVEGATCRQVTVDEGYGVELALNHLIASGHRHIAMVGGRGTVKSTYDKRMRYRSVLRKNGLAFDPDDVCDTDYSINGGYFGMNALFERKRQMPTAILAINDYSAVGVIRSITEHGLGIPEDIALVSFDDTFIAEAVIPKLTSVSYDYEMYGKKLVETAIDQLEKGDTPVLQSFPPRLIVRESSVLRMR